MNRLGRKPPPEPTPEHAVEVMLDGALSKWIISVMTKLFTGYALIAGTFVIFSDEDRWNSSVYQIALQIPGAPHAWGVLLFAGGLVTMLGIWWKRTLISFWGLTIISTWSFFFAISFGYAVFTDNKASFTGVWTYLLISTLSALLAAAHGRTHFAI